MTACLDFGWWYRPDGRRALLTWWENTAVTLDGPGGVELVGYIPDEDTARATFEGWADHCDDPCSVRWVRERMGRFALTDGAA